MKYNTFSLGELATIKYGKNQKNVLSEKGTIPIYGTGGLMGYATKALYSNPSVLIGRKGTIDKVHFVDHPFWTVDTLFYTVINESIVYPKFLYYLLSLSNLSIYNEGTSIPSLRTETLNHLMFRIPNLEYQKKVLSILNPIDTKIRENSLINDNLLEQATVLFNHALHQSESISYLELGSISDVKGGKRLPKGVNLTSKPNSHPYIRVRDLNNVTFASLSSDYEYVDDETQKSIARYITSTGDVLVSIVGTIGLTAIVDETLDNANLTENCVKLTNFRGITPEYILLFLRSSAGVESINKGTVGAVQLKLPIKNIQSISVPLLPPSEMQSLNGILSIVFNQISANVIEAKRLSELRDVLLPKLITEGLCLSDINF